MNEDEFLGALDRRLEENRKLSLRGGMPKELAPVVGFVGSNSWQVVVGVSFLIVSGWFLVDPLGFLGFVRVVLIMR